MSSDKNIEIILILENREGLSFLARLKGMLAFKEKLHRGSVSP
jgi:hypothetical protein